MAAVLFAASGPDGGPRLRGLDACATPADFMASYLLVVAGALGAGQLGRRRGLSARGSDALLLLISLAFLPRAFGGPVAAVLGGGSLLLAGVLRFPRGAGRHALVALWMAVFGLALPARVLLAATPAAAAAPISWQLWTLAFLFTTFLKRSLWSVYDIGVGRLPAWHPIDLLTYLLGLPALLGLAATPSLADWVAARRGGDDPPALARGLETTLICLGWGLVSGLSLIDTRWIFGPLQQPAGQSVGTLGMAVLGLYGWGYLFRLSHEQLSVGLWRLFGHAVRDDFQGALRAASPVDLWRRWNLLWRDFLLQILFFPLALALGRRRGSPGPGGYAVAALATFLGAFVFDAVPLLILLGPARPQAAGALLAGLLAYHLGWGVLVGAGLAGEARARRRAPGGSPRRPPALGSAAGRVAAVGGTYALASLLAVGHTWILSGAQMGLIWRRLLGVG